MSRHGCNHEPHDSWVQVTWCKNCDLEITKDRTGNYTLNMRWGSKEYFDLEG